MSCLYKGELVLIEETKNAMGGTELMRDRIREHVDPELLSKVAIHFSRPREIYDDVPNILYCHDLPNDPEMNILDDKDVMNKFDKFVFVSYNQLQLFNNFKGVPYAKSIVIRNGILSPSDDEINNNFYRVYDDKDPIKLIYHTTPHRGLEILVPVFEKLREEFNIELDVFSSFNAYGWGERDKEYSELFERMDKIPGIKNHGFVPNSEIISHLKETDIFAYPCIWPETSCLSLIEALSYGIMCVHPGLYALPETGLGITKIYDFSEDVNQHAIIFYHTMYSVLLKFMEYRRFGNISHICKSAATMAKSYYDFNSLKQRWDGLLRSLIDA